ncbi:ABC-three component system protein [Selenomonas artemidis]|uniref:ABC-three component system protein n=1 Tax=Selenomonas artemidis TaxID=671224 RepID=UPI00042445D7|nr:ABC-three component system protein [Selenomonas artemidis]
MTFSEYAGGLSAYISYGKSEYDYFTELIGNFIQDAAMDACKLLKRQNDTKYRYIKGIRLIQVKDAQYLYDHRNKEKFSNWIWDRISDSDSYDEISAWLRSHNISSDDPATACADLLESIILDIINNIASSPPSQKSDLDLTLINDIQEKIKSLPRPANVPVPKEATQNEETYIDELFLAYGDAEGMNVFSANDLPSFPDYEEDLNGRRIDFYAAESIRRGVLELGSGSLTDQFDILKSETLVGVTDTAKRTHPNGYERMLAVMEQAVTTPMTNYVLSASPYWIGGRIKKGVCHHLVNDGKLTWIRRRKK